jgi:hypothetical protein
MVCFIVPLIATIMVAFGRKIGKGWIRSTHGFWLNIMMLGGAVFGLIDHAFTGELLLITSAWTTDLAIGGAITAGITTCWGFVVLANRLNRQGYPAINVDHAPMNANSP